MDYTEEATRNAYHPVTHQTVPEAWEVYWPIADAKVKSDKFPRDELKILAACYYIAYLASGAEIDTDGKYTSVSKSIGPASKSVSLGHGTEAANAWLDRYNALIANESGGEIGGCSVSIPPPRTGYRDPVTRRRLRSWWRNR